MAHEVRVELGIGHIAKPSRVTLDAEGKATGGAILSLNETIERIIGAINGLLSLGDGTQGARAGNLDGQYLEFTSPSTPDEEFQVFHGLDRDPAGYIVVRRDKAAILYDSRVGSWSTHVAYFKSNVGTTLFRILVF